MMSPVRTPRRAVSEGAEEESGWTQLHETIILEDLETLVKILRKNQSSVDSRSPVR